MKQRRDGLPDGPDRYPNSSCEYIFFRNIHLCRYQAFLRQRERILQLEIEEEKDPENKQIKIAKLHEVERMLIFLVMDIGKHEKSAGGDYE
jgi:hypothetical protein